MARIRTIKPEFWRNEELASVCAESSLLAIGLLNHADDEGYFNANPKLVESDIFPLRELSRSCTELLTELCNIGYIRAYKTDDGKIYGHIVNFLTHQVINKKKTSIIKPLCVVPYSYGTPTAPVLQGMEGNGKERKGNGKEHTSNSTPLPDAKASDVSVVPSSDIELIFKHWQDTLNHTRSKLDSKRKVTIRTALKNGYTVEDLKHAITGCSNSAFHMGDNDQGRKYDQIDLIFRDSNKIDQFIELYNNPPKARGKQARVESLNQQAASDFLNDNESNQPPASEGDFFDGECSEVNQ